MSTKMDPALELLSNTFASAMTLNGDPDVARAIQQQLPELTAEQEARQAAILSLSERFPDTAAELAETLHKNKFLLGTDAPALVDLITYARVRAPIVAWTAEQCKAHQPLVFWADRVQKSPVFKQNMAVDGLVSVEKLARPKKEKGPKPAPAPAKKEAPTPAAIDLRVGFIQKAIRHPDADGLYVSTIDMGDEQPRTVCSGLVKHVALEDMQERYVIVVANLKPVNMRGIRSEAMVLCAASGEKVEFTRPPAGSKPGDKVYFDGFDGTPEPQLNPKKKVFETLQPSFTTNDKLEVVYRAADGEHRLVNKAGQVVCAETLVGADVR